MHRATRACIFRCFPSLCILDVSRCGSRLRQRHWHRRGKPCSAVKWFFPWAHVVVAAAAAAVVVVVVGGGGRRRCSGASNCGRVVSYIFLCPWRSCCALKGRVAVSVLHKMRSCLSFAFPPSKSYMAQSDENRTPRTQHLQR